MSNDEKDIVTQNIDEMVDMVNKKLKIKAHREELSGRLLSNDTKEKVYSTSLPKEVRDNLGLLVPVTVYMTDPLLAQEAPEIGLEEMKINWESGLTNGPTSARISVVDYDADTNLLEESTKWDPQKWSFVESNGNRLNHKNMDNYQFHQANVWGIVSNVLDFYEDSSVLGRPIPWGFEGNRLIVVPHAGFGENAYYDRDSKSLQFYYCGTKEKPVYTCLSHDIVAHETGHAILDGIRPFYLENTGIQVSAFHEFIADLTAILSAMRSNNLRKKLAKVTEGDLKKAKSLADLAEEFAQEVTGRKYLRSALNPDKMENVREGFSPHSCSQVLTGAMFDIMTRIAANYMEMQNKKGKKHTPSEALWYAIDRFRRVALQPLDYCPPVDICYEDYVNAVFARDCLTNPDDPHEYRKIMREVFEWRDIPFSKENIEPDYSHYHCPNINYITSSRTAAYLFLHEMRELLNIPKEQDFFIADLYAANKVNRASQRMPREIVLEYIWYENIKLEGSRFKNFEGKIVSLLCGGTLVYDQLGNLLYWTRKPGTRFKTGINSTESKKREKDESKAGEKRRQQYLDHIAYCIKQGVTELSTEQSINAPNIWTPFNFKRRNDGTLRLETTPHLRHFGEDK